mgnify:FL=1
MNIILFGPPGAGKGTQADNISKSFNLYKISTGDLLRNEIYKKTSLGIKIKTIIDKGSFVTDEIINDLISKILADKKFYNRLIFDGYPRNLVQAENLDILLKKYNQNISCVLCLNVDKKKIIKRILGRQICSKCGLIFNEFFKPATSNNHACDSKFLVKRSDDNEETILKRYETYIEKTLPIINYYKKLNILHEIDGKTEIDQIFEKISHIIGSLET